MMPSLLRSWILLACLAAVTPAPLQWEQIQPVGQGPAARYYHTAFTFDSQQDSLFIVGGIGASGLLQDTWYYDAAVAGWESVKLDPNETLTDCSVKEINVEAATGFTARAGLASASNGNVSLICGGYTTGKVYVSDGEIIECWWFMPSPLMRMDKLKIKADKKTASHGPLPREGLSMEYDGVLKHFVVLAGRSSTGLHNDCWFIETHATTDKGVIEEEYEWLHCTPPEARAGITARYGHGSVFFASQEAMYVWGGFADNGLATIAMSDMWRLQDYFDGSASAWIEVMPESEKPIARGYMAMWLSDFKVIIHGGEGEGGAGIASVLSDTWSFNLWTRVWSQFGTSDAVPVASHLAVQSVRDGVAVSFGGRVKDTTPGGSLFVFDEISGWTRVLPAGDRPARRAGHVAVHDDASYKMIIFGGMTHAAKILQDIWILDLQTNKWSCAHGTTSEICLEGDFPPGQSPGPKAFAAEVGIGLHKFVFGGITDLPCGTKPTVKNSMWALNLATYKWQQIMTGADTKPPARAMADMANPGTLGADLKQTVVLFGGASFECFGDNPPCEVPQPMNDLWYIDVAAKEERQSVDQMLDFDGIDDIVAIELPAWCNSGPEFLSVLWIDAWVNVVAKGQVKTMLFEAYSDKNPVLRWHLQGVGDFLQARLIFQPNGVARTVKIFGGTEFDKLNQNFLGFWHHIAFTVRFAKIFSSTSSGPSAIITQAFMFVDGEAVRELGTTFLALDLTNNLEIKTGLSHVFVGGPNPSVGASGVNFLQGGVDNVRVWWPSCPGSGDPTRCNPYGFLYPKLADGTRRPNARYPAEPGQLLGEPIHDADVEMEMVAKPVLEFMYKDDLEDAQGLLIALNFNTGKISGSKVSDSRGETEECTGACIDVKYCGSASSGPAYETCSWGGSEQSPDDMCESNCVFGNCGNFDTQCMERGVDDSASLEEYGVNGKCLCRNVKDCILAPLKSVKDCACPGGLRKRCTVCSISQVDTSTGAAGCEEEGNGPPDRRRLLNQPPGQEESTCKYLAVEFCPEELCTEWDCSCHNSFNLANEEKTFMAPSEATSYIFEETDTATCACQTSGDSLQDSVSAEQTQIEGTMPPQFETTTYYRCCDSDQFLGPTNDFGGTESAEIICHEWTTTVSLVQNGPGPAQEEVSYNCTNWGLLASGGEVTADCGIKKCCRADSSSSSDPGPPGGDDGTNQVQAQDLGTCTVSNTGGSGELLTLVCDLDVNQLPDLQGESFSGSLGSNRRLMSEDNLPSPSPKLATRPASPPSASPAAFPSKKKEFKLSAKENDLKDRENVNDLVQSILNLAQGHQNVKSKPTYDGLLNRRSLLSGQNEWYCDGNQESAAWQTTSAIGGGQEFDRPYVKIKFTTTEAKIGQIASCWEASGGRDHDGNCQECDEFGHCQPGDCGLKEKVQDIVADWANRVEDTVKENLFCATETGGCQGVVNFGNLMPEEINDPYAADRNTCNTPVADSGFGCYNYNDVRVFMTGTSEICAHLQPAEGEGGGGGTTASGGADSGSSGTTASGGSSGTTASGGGGGGSDTTASGGNGGSSDTTTASGGNGQGNGGSSDTTTASAGNGQGNAETTTASAGNGGNAVSTTTAAAGGDDTANGNDATTSTAASGGGEEGANTTTASAATTTTVAVSDDTTTDMDSDATTVAATTSTEDAGSDATTTTPSPGGRRLLQEGTSEPTCSGTVQIEIWLAVRPWGGLEDAFTTATSSDWIFGHSAGLGTNYYDTQSDHPLCMNLAFGNGLLDVQTQTYSQRVGATCGNGIIEDLEFCDDTEFGVSMLGSNTACTKDCYCNEGFSAPPILMEGVNTTTCTCDKQIDFSLRGQGFTETTQLIGEDNVISVALDIYTEMRTQDGGASTPIVFTISGLTGTLTTGTEVDLRCDVRETWNDAPEDGDFAPCQALGYCNNLEDSAAACSAAKGRWDQDSGTLKFSVLNDMANGQELVPMPGDGWQLTIRFTLTNSGAAQTGIFPKIYVCRSAPPQQFSDLGYEPLLTANKKEMRTDGTPSTITKFSDGKPVQVLTVQLSEGTWNEPNKVAVISAVQTDLMDQRVLNKFAAGAANAGPASTFIKAEIEEDGEPGGEFPSGVKIRITATVDKSLVREQGGCFITEDKRLKVCASGWVGLFRYNEFTEVWEERTIATYEGRTSSAVSVDTDEFSSWAVLSTPPCNDYEGAGRSGGEKVCRTDALQNNEGHALLGDGTTSKTPGITRSTRPLVSREQDMAAYLQSTGRPEFNVRGNWTRVAPWSETTTPDPCWTDSTSIGWIPPRFGHTMESLTTTRIVVYSGVGCVDWTVPTSGCRVCKNLTVLDDLWEIDLLKIGVESENPWTELLMSPALSGLFGMTSVPFPNTDDRLIVFGGTPELFFINLINNEASAPATGFKKYRDLRFRAGKATEQDISSFSSISSHSEVANSTHVVLFGGFVKNMLTSAVYIYDLSAASPSLGMRAYPVLASGPSARAFPGVAKPDEVTLILYGGVQPAESESGYIHQGTTDLWSLDLNTQKWTLVHESQIPTGPDTSVFGAFTTMTFGGNVVLLTHGGVRAGYDGSTETATFRVSNNEDSDGSDGLVASTAKVWFSFNLYLTQQDKETWIDVRITNFGTSGEDEGIKPRAMHTLQSGRFVAGQESLMMYGGLNTRGVALSEMYRIDSQNSVNTYEYAIPLSGITKAKALAGIADLLTLINTGFGYNNVGPWADQAAFPSCPEDAKWDFHDPKVYNQSDFDYIPSGSVVVTFKTKTEIYQACVLCLMIAPDRYQAEAQSKLTNASAYYSANFDQTISFQYGPIYGEAYESIVAPFNFDWRIYNDETAGQFALYNQIMQLIPAVEILMDSILYDSFINDDNGCRTNCMRGLCQGTPGTTKQNSHQKNSAGETIFCYEDQVCDPVSADYVCSLPGKRHGHAVASLNLGGVTPLMLLVGGETSDINADETTLSRDVFSAHFSTSIATWTKLVVADDSYAACSASNDCSDDATCPCARRDASVAVMGNAGSDNGRLLLFGGYTFSASTSSSPLSAYLSRSTTIGVTPLNDLWYLELNDLSEECVRDGECSTLPWYRVIVPGNKPMARWGAGMVLDNADNLYIMGGATYASSTFGEASDLFVFQLRDPFYQRCSATGSGLTAAVAGVPANFFLQCLDAFNEPASGARFKIDITGDVDIAPSAFSVGTGLYQVTYTPVKASAAYTVTIRVGRGGSVYQDLIAGYDSDPTDSTHQYLGYYADIQGVTTNQNPYSLAVKPGSTDPMISTATGEAITIATSGVVREFTIVARDFAENRRPGGDIIDAQMTLWDTVKNEAQDSHASPSTGKVTDNSDGSYTVTYSITQSGNYQLTVKFSGTVGVNTPVILDVHTDVPVIVRTYAYGDIASISAGAASTIWVQTRDRYGNFIRVYPSLEPSGRETIGFELCKNERLKECENGVVCGVVCGGGEIENSVGITISYGDGPSNTQTNPATGQPYFGLYQIVFFPFNEGSFEPSVLHNSVYVDCIFSTGEDPGQALADQCVNQILENRATATTRRSLEDSQRVRTTKITVYNPDTQVESDEASLDPSARRQTNTSSIGTGTKTVIQSAFTPPDNSTAELWLFWAPIIAACLGAFFDLLLGCSEFISHRIRQKRMQGMEVNMKERVDSEEPEIAGVAEPPKSRNLVEASPDVNGMQDATGDVFAELLNQGHLSKNDVEQCRTLAASGDPRILGALDSHERSVSRTAVLFKKLVAAKNRNGNSSNGGSNADSGGSAPPAEERLAV